MPTVLHRVQLLQQSVLMLRLLHYQLQQSLSLMRLLLV